MISGIMIDFSLFTYIFSIYFFSNRTGPHMLSNILGALLIGLIALKTFKEGKKIKINAFLIAFSTFVILACISYFVAVDKNLALKMIKTLSTILILIFALAQYLDSEKKAERVYAYIFVSGLLASVYILINFQNAGSLRLGRILGQPNIVALLIANSLLFGFFKMIYSQITIKSRIYYGIANIVLFITIVLTGSRRAVIFGLIGIVILLIQKYRKNYAMLLKILLLSLGALFVFAFIIVKVPLLYKIIGIRFEHIIDFVLGRPITKELSIPMRDYMLRFGMDLFKNKPILGYGINNYRVLLGEARGWNTYAHNNLIELMVGTGIVGVIAYYSMYAVTFYRNYIQYAPKLAPKDKCTARCEDANKGTASRCEYVNKGTASRCEGVNKGIGKSTTFVNSTPVFAWGVASLLVEALAVQYYSKIFYLVLAAFWGTFSIKSQHSKDHGSGFGDGAQFAVNDNNPKRICFLSETLSRGGSEKAIATISANLPMKYDKTIILYNAKEITYPYKGRIVDLKSYAAASPLGKLASLISRINNITRIKEEACFDVSVSFMDSLNIINILSARDEKIVVSVRNDLYTNPKDRFATVRNAILKVIYKRADLVVAVSEEIKLQLKEKYNIANEKLKVIYNGIDLDYITRMSKEDIEGKYREIFNHPCIITSGRLTQQKGQRHLIKAFKRIKENIEIIETKENAELKETKENIELKETKENIELKEVGNIKDKLNAKATYKLDAKAKATAKSIKLIILGEGELDAELRALAETLGLQNDIHFIGFKKNPHKYIARADVFVLPSIYEGFPNSLIEAMALSVPVISTCCRTGPVEILHPKASVGYKVDKVNFAEYGVIVPELSDIDMRRDNKGENSGLDGSVDRLEEEEIVLAEAILKMLEDEALGEHYKQKSLERAKDFDIKKIIGEWEEII